MIYKFPVVNNFVKVEQGVFVNGILLGGSLTDYYNVIDRNYNMGSDSVSKTELRLISGAMVILF